MATIKENMIMRSSDNLLSKQNTNSLVQSTSWADRSASTLEGENAVCKTTTSSNAEERFFLVKRQEGSFDKTSPFLIHKSIQGLVGEPKTIKKIRSGELLIEVQNNIQANNLKKCTHFANIAVSVTPHKYLNTSRGVISESDLLNVSEDEIVDNLKDQNVIEAHRITIYRQDQQSPTIRTQIPTKHIILTFNTPKLPNSIKAGYLSCSVRPYIPNPLRCFRCQRFGHSKTSCRGSAKCGRCSAEGHESLNCQAAYCCVNCNGNHPSYSKSCEKWKIEKEIQTIRTKQNISYPEAKKIVDSRTPTVGLSYSASASKAIQKSYATKATQTYVTLAIQTDSITVQNEQSKNAQHNISNRNQDKQPTKTTKSHSASQYVAPKLPVHKRQSQDITKTQPQKQNRRSASSKTDSIKSHSSTSKKKKIQAANSVFNSKAKEKIKNSNEDDDAIDIHVDSELSDDEEDRMLTSTELT